MHFTLLNLIETGYFYIYSYIYSIFIILYLHLFIFKYYSKEMWLYKFLLIIYNNTIYIYYIFLNTKYGKYYFTCVKLLFASFVLTIIIY